MWNHRMPQAAKEAVLAIGKMAQAMAGKNAKARIFKIQATFLRDPLAPADIHQT
jgi:hypothetical protein